MISLTESVKMIEEFQQDSLTNRIFEIESVLEGSDKHTCTTELLKFGVNPSILESAIVLKRITGQIHVLIHAIGILVCLPKLLLENEKIEYLSLGAGNTGREFDLETNFQIGEFKFINWQGGSESIRQNSIFKDFYYLAENDTTKKRCLYLLDLEHPLSFLKNKRSLESVMSKNNKLWKTFQNKYGTRFRTVNEYYEFRKTTVQFIDINTIIPNLGELLRSSDK